MSARTAATVNDDLVAAIERDTQENSPRRSLGIEATCMGHVAGLNYDTVESLLEYGEGEQHR